MPQRAAPATAGRHLLLAVTTEGDPLPLVESAAQASSGLRATWSVVAVDTPVSESERPRRRALLLQALDRAQQLGATVTRISIGSGTPSALVSAVVHRARSENATALMIGRHRAGRSGWLPAGQGLGEFTDVLAELLPGVAIHLVCPPGATPDSVRPRRFDGRGLLRAAGEWPRVALALAACTLVSAALEQYLHPANVVMVFLAGVVYVASKAGRVPAIATVLGSIFLYDLIFVAPRWSLKPTEPQYWLAFLVMMVVGLIISQLAARSREQALLAEARAQRTQALNQLAVALGRARDREAVARAVCAAVQSSVGAPAVLLFAAESGTGVDPAQPPPAGFDARAAQAALAAGAELGAGTAADAAQPLRYVPVMTGETTFGLLVLPPPPPDRDTLEDRHLVRALANQAALALERSDLERRSVAAAVDAEVERTRNTLLASISHDFRTPLTSIVGSATTLLEQSPALDDAHRRSLLETLLGEARRLHVLTSNLLDLTRLDEGAIALRPEWCPADELLEAARRQLEPRLRAHRFEARAPDDAWVWCDPRLVDQALVNLLDNAVQHTPPGGAVRAEIGLGATCWTLVVHDDGPGIAPGQERAIFRKFHRAGGPGDSAGKGLGLAICAAIAALHGGEIVVENAGGARFTMTLPQPALPDLDAGEAA